VQIIIIILLFIIEEIWKGILLSIMIFYPNLVWIWLNIRESFSIDFGIDSGNSVFIKSWLKRNRRKISIILKLIVLIFWKLILRFGHLLSERIRSSLIIGRIVLVEKGMVFFLFCIFCIGISDVLLLVEIIIVVFIAPTQLMFLIVWMVLLIHLIGLVIFIGENIVFGDLCAKFRLSLFTYMGFFIWMFLVKRIWAWVWFHHY